MLCGPCGDGRGRWKAKRHGPSHLGLAWEQIAFDTGTLDLIGRLKKTDDVDQPGASFIGVNDVVGTNYVERRDIVRPYHEKTKVIVTAKASVAVRILKRQR